MAEETNSGKWVARKGRLEELDRKLDIKFWQSRPAAERFSAAWELALNYHINVLGQDESELRLQRPLKLSFGKRS